jgi:DNA-binding NarL/FixJ family response regulator
MKLIVCESSGGWATSIRRRLPPDVSLVETRSLAETAECLEQSPTAMLALEWNADKAELLLAEIARIGRRRPQVAVVVLSQRDPTCLPSACLEAGAIHVIASRRQVGEIVEIVEHQIKTGAWNIEEENHCANSKHPLLAGLPGGD